MCYDFLFFHTSVQCFLRNAMSAQDCKCIFDLNFPRVSNSVPYSFYSTVLQQYFEAARYRVTPRFDRLLMMCLSTPLPQCTVRMPTGTWRVVIFRYARSDHTIQLPPSLYYKC